MDLKNKTIIVGLSGGVDSSVSAALLKAQGANVHGLFMKNWEEDDTSTYCSAEKDLADVRAICHALEIPLQTINFSDKYWEKVFSIFLEEYKQGRTPNPDILCNKEIKFKAFLDHAIKLGADFIATGHYAKRTFSTLEEPIQLLRSDDENKDQSYFLYTLNQTALQHSLFPVGHLNKPFVRETAKKLSLLTHNKKDSTGICFIGERKFKSFLQEFFLNEPGDILTDSGVSIGKHDGLMYYTLGQRQGLYIGGKKGYPEKPWYVISKDITQNTLIVTQDENHPGHYSTSLNAQNLHWVSGSSPKTHFHASAKVRYRQPDQACLVKIKDDASIDVEFTHPQRAVTPGQSVVLYDGNVCLGGGIIRQTNSPGGIITSQLSKKTEHVI